MKNILDVLELLDAEAALVETRFVDGVEWLVVQLVGLVEGVLHASNSATPELALADEFVQSIGEWPGVPVLLDHPKDASGAPISASTPGVCAARAFGYVSDARLDASGKKLVMTAWLDVARARELGGDALRAVERAKAGQTTDVSVGVYTSRNDERGVFNGKEYVGVWRRITPDHLAILPQGKRGACTLDDGCGLARAASGDEQAARDSLLTEGELCEVRVVRAPDPFQKYRALAGAMGLTISAAEEAAWRKENKMEHTCPCQKPEATCPKRARAAEEREAPPRPLTMSQWYEASAKPNDAPPVSLRDDEVPRAPSMTQWLTFPK